MSPAVSILCVPIVNEFLTGAAALKIFCVEADVCTRYV